MPGSLDTVYVDTTSTRERLVQSGVELLENGGLANLTLRRIAKRAGVSHGAPRHHFATYESLLAAIARTGIQDLDALISPCFQHPDAREAVRGAARVYVDFARARPEMFDLISRHDLLEGAGGHLRDITGRWFADLQQAVASVAGGRCVALALWSGVHGLAVLTSRRATSAVSAVPADVSGTIDLLVDSLLGEG